MSDNSSGGYSPPGAPPQTPGLPQNPLPIIFSGFTGLNTKASAQGIQDQEMSICDGMMPLGPNNLRILPDLGTAIYTAGVGRTIKNFGFGNIGSTPICIVCLDDGSLVQVNTVSHATTVIAPAGTITGFNPAYSQWSSLYSIIVAPQVNGYFLWDGTNLYKSGTIGPEVNVINGGKNYTGSPTFTIPTTGAQATGEIVFGGNPSPGDTITLNGVVWTFVASGASGNQTNIAGTVGVTIATLRIGLNASSVPALAVATYSQNLTTHLVVTYDTTGVIGNTYTLAASVATPSGPTLTGGVDGGGGIALTGTIENGSLVSVQVTNPGSGYSVGDFVIVTTSAGGSDNMASATAIIASSSLSGITSVQVVDGGTGYSALTNVTDASGTAITPATFAVVGTAGVITGVQVLTPGYGYPSPPALTVTDPATSPGSGGSVQVSGIASGQIASITVTSGGSNYTATPTVTVVGDGTGAVLKANISAGAVSSVDVVSAGTGYTKAGVIFSGGNNAAQVLVTLMPFGVSGTTVETYESRVWVGNVRNIILSSPSDPANFSVTDGSAVFPASDSFLRVAYQKFLQSNGFIYFLADSSINYGSGVNTAGNPVITTFNNLNVDPQIGTPWPDTVQAFGRNIVFANPIGVYVSYGGSVTKVSDALDGIYTTVAQSSWAAGFAPSAAVMEIFGIQVYILLMPILDQVSGSQVTKCLMWDGKKWWTSPQSGITVGFAASQEINSVLTAYCSPEQTTIKPMFTTPTTANTMTKYLYSKLWDSPGVFVTKMIREWFVLLNANSNSIATQATGTIFFAANPSDGATITLDSTIWTFVAGTPVGNQTQIQGTTQATITVLKNQLNVSSDPFVSLATYTSSGGPGTSTLTITYKTSGTAGNAFTLAASAATPSGPTLTGGTNAEQVFIASVTENGVGAERGFNVTRTGPVIIGPIPAADSGRIMGVRLRTLVRDSSFNTITLFNQGQQSNV